MATERQIQANRNNARKSTGPATAAGKTASAGNATTHGLFSSVVKLGADERASYEQLHASLTRRFRPADELERLLLDRAVVAAWKLRKTLASQTSLLLDTPWERYPGSVNRTIASIGDVSQINWLRYEQHFERAMYRALKTLRDYQALRQHDPDLGISEAEQAPAQNEPNIDISADATSNVDTSSPTPSSEVVTPETPVTSETPVAPEAHETPVDARRRQRKTNPISTTERSGLPVSTCRIAKTTRMEAAPCARALRSGIGARNGKGMLRSVRVRRLMGHFAKTNPICPHRGRIRIRDDSHALWWRL